MGQALFSPDLAAQPSLAPNRKAALMLHSMARSDQEWVLDRLDQERRTTVVGLLNELSDLGIPSDTAFVKEVLQVNQSELKLYPLNPTKDVGAMVERLSQADSCTIFQTLVHEPVGLIARFLSYCDWPWKNEVMFRFQELMRYNLEEQLLVFEDGRKLVDLDHCILRVVFERIDLDLADQAPKVAEPKLMGRIKNTILRWSSSFGKRVKE